MAYDITKSNGERLTIVSDRTVDSSSSSISLVGKNYTGYGEIIAENLVHMLENFSSPAAPANPIIGQLWWQSDIEKLKLYTGSANGWVPLNPPLTKIKPVIANYEVTVNDHGSYIRVDSSSAKTITLPNTSTIPVGTTVTIGRAGAGEVTIEAAGGAIVEPRNLSIKRISTQFGRVTAIKVAQSASSATWEIEATAGGIGATESWAVTADPTTVSEGNSVTWTVISNASSGTYYWTIGGSVSGADFSDNLGMSGTFVLGSDGRATITKTLSTIDGAESPEQIIFSIQKTQGGATVPGGTSTVTVTDPTYIPPTTTTTTAAPFNGTTTTTQSGGNSNTTTTQSGQTTTTQSGQTTTTRAPTTTTAAPTTTQAGGGDNAGTGATGVDSGPSTDVGGNTGDVGVGASTDVGGNTGDAVDASTDVGGNTGDAVDASTDVGGSTGDADSTGTGVGSADAAGADAAGAGGDGAGGGGGGGGGGAM